MKDWDFDDRGWYPPSRPRRAKGGIRAQSQRGGFAEHWWAKRWIETLESFDIASRLQRGRSYARSGQVTSLRIVSGLIDAQVQGSRPKPYGVRIEIPRLTPDEWQKVIDVVAGRAAYAARLLAGEMPQDIEDAFAAAGVSLFPTRSRDLATACTCPDWSNPCKHIAAVFYLVGEEFDRDPFLLFRLRGLQREQLMERLGGAAPRAETTAPGEQMAPTSTAEQTKRSKPKRAARKRSNATATSAPAALDVVSEATPLDADPARFWQAQPLPTDFFGVVQPPATHAALVRRLGRFPLWRGETPIVDAIEANYRHAAEEALQMFVAGGQDKEG